MVLKISAKIKFYLISRNKDNFNGGKKFYFYFKQYFNVNVRQVKELSVKKKEIIKVS